jgi:fructosamine-3-kinase
MSHDVAGRVTRAIGVPALEIQPLSGGCVGEVYRVQLGGGDSVVVKVDNGPAPRLDVEAFMLQYLRGHSALPVPEVRWSAPDLLIMEFLAGNSHFTPASEVHAADLLTSLHAVRGKAFGLDRATLIGGLHQPNPWTDSWTAFFRDQRLGHMADGACRAGIMPADFRRRFDRFLNKLDQLLPEPAFPALLHGDVWTTNVLASGDKITGFIDPAVYFGHPEIELAFITLFSTFGQRFFDAYHATARIDPGFFEERRHIYNLYPLLVHTRLFGASYLSGVAGTLNRFGC